MAQMMNLRCLLSLASAWEPSAACSFITTAVGVASFTQAGTTSLMAATPRTIIPNQDITTAKLTIRTAAVAEGIAATAVEGIIAKLGTKPSVVGIAVAVTGEGTVVAIAGQQGAAAEVPVGMQGGRVVRNLCFKALTTAAFEGTLIGSGKLCRNQMEAAKVLIAK